ncbi:hypothetical protein F8203_gp018 [Heliothis virescens ascovirus 3f]|uniref:Uncharacterized protein n=1 Tax=Heliothis virescens ascovirus 3f TaxID=328614 RepID=A0A171PVA3_9VIRU|nr:hypothetical protein F8203_gp018 [Heliothis virescens ascovirus 3f]AJP08984.1 hypothetical protein [Heliothis virescens ascovirus 3f]
MTIPPRYTLPYNCTDTDRSTTSESLNTQTRTHETFSKRTDHEYGVFVVFAVNCIRAGFVALSYTRSVHLFVVMLVN